MRHDERERLRYHIYYKINVDELEDVFRKAYGKVIKSIISVAIILIAIYGIGLFLNLFK